MRIQAFLLPFIAAATTALAQPSPPATANPAAGQSTREAALDNLLAERESIQALDAAVAEARKSGVSEQAILEARFLYHVDRREDAAIAALLPEFLKQLDVFKIEDSAIFGLKEDFLAVVEYVKAIAALGKNDKEGFKKHITEAFWLSPRQASAFAPHIERMRLEEAMRAVKIDFTLKLKSVTPGDAIALDALLAGKKAMLFHFWSPLSQECEAAMPDFITTAQSLSGHGIAVVSLIVDDSPELITPARELIGTLGNKTPGAWLVDSKDKPLGRDLRIQNLPTMVLVSPDGKVLFNGDPTDDAFWETLARTDANITRPDSGQDAPE